MTTTDTNAAVTILREIIAMYDEAGIAEGFGPHNTPTTSDAFDALIVLAKAIDPVAAIQPAGRVDPVPYEQYYNAPAAPSIQSQPEAANIPSDFKVPDGYVLVDAKMQAMFCGEVKPEASELVPVDVDADLWIHEDMARVATAAVVSLPRKELEAAYIQAREDWAYWKRRALTAKEQDALPVIRDLDAIGMALAARLTKMEFMHAKGGDYLLRDAVMREVVEWRRMWDANAAARPDFADRARQAAAIAQPSGAVPDGWKLVPTHPDQRMIAAFLAEYHRPGGAESTCYRNMLAAAPQPPASAPEVQASPAARPQGR